MSVSIPKNNKTTQEGLVKLCHEYNLTFKLFELFF